MSNYFYNVLHMNHRHYSREFTKKILIIIYSSIIPLEPVIFRADTKMIVITYTCKDIITNYN